MCMINQIVGLLMLSFMSYFRSFVKVQLVLSRSARRWSVLCTTSVVSCWRACARVEAPLVRGVVPYTVVVW